MPFQSRMAFALFLFALVFSPLAFGAVAPWSCFLLEALCFGAALTFFLSPANRQTVYRVPGFMPLVLLLLFATVQIMPLPAGLVRVLSPSTWAIYQESIGLIYQPAWLTLSIAPSSSLAELLRISAYVFFYLLTVHLLADRERLEKTVRAVIGLGTLIALQAILQKHFSNGKIYWFYEAPAPSGFLGPYLNYNHCAAFLGMVVPVALALYFCHRPRRFGGASWRQRLASALAHPGTNRCLRLGLASLVMAVAILVSSSRGGTVSFCLSTLILLAVLSRREKKSLPALLAGLVLVIAIAWAVGESGWAAMDRRFGSAFNQDGELTDGRLQVWKDSLSIIADFPYLGTGWGTFGSIYPSYRTVAYGNFYYQAHNDYLETLISGGLVSAVFLVWFLLAVGREVLATMRRRHDHYAIYLTIGSLVGCLSLLFHSVTDFNFQIPANGLYFFFFAGLAVSAASTRSTGHAPTYLARRKSRAARAGLAFAAGILLLSVVVIFAGRILSERHLATANGMGLTAGSPPEDLRRMVAEMERAVVLAPLDSAVSYRAAEGNALLGEAAAASRLYRRAIRLDPAQAFFLMDYGRILAVGGEMKRAAEFMAAGVRRQRAWPDYRRDYARLLFSGGDRAQGLLVMAEVFALDPARTADDLKLLADNGVTVDEIRQALRLASPRAVIRNRPEDLAAGNGN